MRDASLDSLINDGMDMPEKFSQALEIAREEASKTTDWQQLHNNLFGFEGKMNNLFPAKQERMEFAESPQYSEIMALLQSSLSHLEVNVKTEKPATAKFVVNHVFTENYPVVRQSVGCETMEKAVEIAVKLVMEQQDSDNEEQVRAELDSDGYYVPSKHAEWSVCINEIM